MTAPDCPRDEVPHLLVFADLDVPYMLFAGAGAELAANRAFELHAQSWTCRLYRCIRETGHSAPSAGRQPA
jgi:hypothetical protein